MHLESRSVALNSSVERQATKTSLTWGRHLIVGALATLLVALCAHISILLPFTPVPVTMQTFSVLLIAMVLGPLEASAALCLYLAEGAIGLPVFSPHGGGGVAQLCGTSGGYLLCYPFAAFLAGTVFSTMKRHVPVLLASLTAAFVASGIILLSGTLWLAITLRLSFLTALRVGALPFVAGDLFKIALVATAVAALQRSRRAGSTLS